MKKVTNFLFSLVITTFLLGLLVDVAFTSNTYAWLQDYEYDIYGFWSGLWHGVIAPIAVFAQIFDQSIILYSPVNTGFGYNIGFLLGIGFMISGITSGYYSQQNSED